MAEIRDKILAGWAAAMERIADGESARAVCKSNGWPWSTFHDIAKDADRSVQYAHARESGWWAMAEDIRAVAEDASGDIAMGEDGRPRVNHENIQRSRLKVDTYKWLLSKMLPKVFAEKVVAEMQGPGGGPVRLEASTLHAIALDVGDRASALAFVAKLAAGVAGALPAPTQPPESEDAS